MLEVLRFLYPPGGDPLDNILALVRDLAGPGCFYKWKSGKGLRRGIFTSYSATEVPPSSIHVSDLARGAPAGTDEVMAMALREAEQASLLLFTVLQKRPRSIGGR